MLHRIYILIILALTALAADAQNVTVETSLDSASIFIGQQLKMRAVVSCDKGAKVKFPNYDNGYLVPGLEVLEASKVDTTFINNGKRWELTREYTLTAFDSAAFVIPRLDIEVNGKNFQSRNELGLKVNTVELDEGNLGEARPLMAPVDAVFAWSPRIFLWSLIPTIALFVIVLLSGRIGTPRPIVRRIKVTPPPLPHVAGLAGLADLQKDLDGNSAYDSEATKGFYMALSTVLRQYLAERFECNAREMTTSEITALLTAKGETQSLDDLRTILTTSDFVKFAKFVPSAIENGRILHLAITYIETTKVEPAPEDMVKEKTVVVGDVAGRRIRTSIIVAVSVLASIIIFFTTYTTFLLWESFF